VTVGKFGEEIDLDTKRIIGHPETAAHCLRTTGTERAWFVTKAEAEAFARNPANVHYRGDIAHFCPYCEFWHLSRKEWLKPVVLQ